MENTHTEFATHWIGSGKNEANEKLSDMSPLVPSALI